jgi:hypothetical protein
MKNKGLVIRYFSGGYFLCDGKAPEGHENDGELYVGNTVKWFETWDEANAMREALASILSKETITKEVYLHEN